MSSSRRAAAVWRYPPHQMRATRRDRVRREAGRSIGNHATSTAAGKTPRIVPACLRPRGSPPSRRGGDPLGEGHRRASRENQSFKSSTAAIAEDYGLFGVADRAGHIAQRQHQFAQVVGGNRGVSPVFVGDIALKVSPRQLNGLGRSAQGPKVKGCPAQNNIVRCFPHRRRRKVPRLREEACKGSKVGTKRPEVSAAVIHVPSTNPRYVNLVVR